MRSSPIIVTSGPIIVFDVMTGGRKTGTQGVSVIEGICH